MRPPEGGRRATGGDPHPDATMDLRPGSRVALEADAVLANRRIASMLHERANRVKPAKRL
jgi:hypothetical protein